MAAVTTTTDLPSGVPCVVPSCAITALPIGPLEAFVFSRVDGALSVSEIANVTGLNEPQVTTIVRRLVDLGALTVPGWRGPPSPPRPEESGSRRPTIPPNRSNQPGTPTPVLPAPSAYAVVDDDGWDLDAEMRERISSLFARLDDVDHYELLGVPRHAGRKAIKSAYYGLAAAFHTDRYFGRDLGPYKAKLEQIFVRITQAHDALASARSRAEYDETLGPAKQSPAIGRGERGERGEDLTPPTMRPPFVRAGSSRESDSQITLVPATPPSRGGREASATIAHSPPPSSGARSSPNGPPVRPPESAATASAKGMSPESSPSAASVPLAAPSSRSPAASQGATVLTQEEADARRRALARRLSGSEPALGEVRAPRGSSPSPPPGSPLHSSADVLAATGAIKHRYDEAVSSQRQGQAQRFVEAAVAALGQGDVVAAANHYRLAVKFTEDPAVRAAFEETDRKARVQLSESFVTQARAEEKSSRWSAAATAYCKALEGRPEDPEIAERAANALRLAKRDLLEAGRLAQLSVQKRPSNGDYRVTLAQVYIDSGLMLRARRELEMAIKLSPDNAHARQLLDQVRKAGW